MIRVPVEIDDHPSGALIDTGAAFSTISASFARQSGVELLSRAVTVGSSTRKVVAVRVGIAKRLQLGNAVLENVVFIVIPDSGWGIPLAFHICAIVGMPVLMALGRMAFVNSHAPAFLYDVPRGNPAARENAAHPNLLLSGLEPLVVVHLPETDEPLRMELDTGANRTHFSHNALADAPMLLARAKRYVWHFSGMGGAVTERRALRVPAVPVTIGGRTIRMKDVLIGSRASRTSDGVIGADLLRHGVRWTMDFKTMTLAVSN